MGIKNNIWFLYIIFLRHPTSSPRVKVFYRIPEGGGLLGSLIPMVCPHTLLGKSLTGTLSFLSYRCSHMYSSIEPPRNRHPTPLYGCVCVFIACLNGEDNVQYCVTLPLWKLGANYICINVSLGGRYSLIRPSFHRVLVLHWVCLSWADLHWTNVECLRRANEMSNHCSTLAQR